MVAGWEQPMQPVGIELVLGAEEDRGQTLRFERGVQAVMDVAEKEPHGIETHRRPQDVADLARLVGGWRGGELHALRVVAAFDRMRPDSLVGFGLMAFLRPLSTSDTKAWETPISWASCACETVRGRGMPHNH